MNHRRRSRTARRADRINLSIQPVRPPEAWRRLNTAAESRFGMSGREFKVRFAAGAIPNPDRREVIEVAMLIAPTNDPNHHSDRSFGPLPTRQSTNISPEDRVRE